MSLSIRVARSNEVVTIAELIADQPLFLRYGATAAGLAKQFAAALERGDLVLVAEDDGLRGMAWLEQNGGLGLGGYLRLIATAKGAKSRGVGAALLAEVEARTERKHLFLLVSDFNDGAQRFYERHGYAPCGRLPGVIRPEVDELIYYKRLRST